MTTYPPKVQKHLDRLVELNWPQASTPQTRSILAHLTMAAKREGVELPKKKKLPSRSQAGMLLQIEDGEAFVVSFGYGSSLLSASDHCELISFKDYEPKQLSKKQQSVIDLWMDRMDDYIDASQPGYPLV